MLHDRRRDSEFLPAQDCLSEATGSAIPSTHSQVLINEALVWKYVGKTIFNTLNSLRHARSPAQDLNVIEIGGGALIGLETLRKLEHASGNSLNMNYLIVDEHVNPEHDKINALHARHELKSLRDISYDRPLDFVIAVRALEYDVDFEKTLAKLQEWSRYPAYAIFAHNAQDSRVFSELEIYKNAARFRYDVLISIKDHIITDSSRAPDLSHYIEIAIAINDVNQLRFIETMKLQYCSTDTDKPVEQIINDLTRHAEAYNRVLQRANNAYGERIESGRFWSEKTAIQLNTDFLSSQTVLLERHNLIIGDTHPLIVHVDTVDLYNAWLRLGKTDFFDTFSATVHNIRVRA